MTSQNSHHKLGKGDVVARTVDGRRGVILAVDETEGASTYGIRWFGGLGTGGGWKASDLYLERTAAEDAEFRARMSAKDAERIRAALISRVRQAAAPVLDDWHADDVEAEIARVEGAADVDAYRAASREGARHALGAKGKIVIWNAVHRVLRRGE